MKKEEEEILIDFEIYTPELVGLLHNYDSLKEFMDQQMRNLLNENSFKSAIYMAAITVFSKKIDELFQMIHDSLGLDDLFEINNDINFDNLLKPKDSFIIKLKEIDFITLGSLLLNERPFMLVKIINVNIEPLPDRFSKISTMLKANHILNMGMGDLMNEREE